MAMVFSDGVWYDQTDRLFKMWYMGGHTRATCYTTSKDGLQWEKPILNVKKGTNSVQTDPRDSATVWLDLDEFSPFAGGFVSRYSNATVQAVHVEAGSGGQDRLSLRLRCRQ